MTVQGSSGSEPQYSVEASLGTSGETERQRQVSFSADWDPGAIRYLETLGTRDGWTCLRPAQAQMRSPSGSAAASVPPVATTRRTFNRVG
jgi:hypothetical protein